MKRAALILSFAAGLAGCAAEPVGGPLTIEVAATSPVSALQLINENGLRCWIRSGDRAFARYRLVPELDTRVGKPRILILDRRATTGRPKLVIESTGEPVTVATYGPLTRTSLGARVNTDIMRWTTGNSACGPRG